MTKKQSEEVNLKKWFQIIASIFLVYHLVTILTLPNSGSYLESQIGEYLYPYASTLGLNSTWQFFSPKPSPRIFFRYEVEFPNGDYQKHQWPPPKIDSEFLGPNFQRLVYHSRMTTITEQRRKKFLVPFLCSKHPGAQTLTLSAIFENVVPLRKAYIDRRLPTSSLKELEVWSRETYYCQEEGEN